MRFSKIIVGVMDVGWGEGLAIMSLVLPTYVTDTDTTYYFCRHDILKRNQYFSTTLDTRCRDMSAPFWVNEDMSDMSRHVFRHLQLSAEAD